MSDNLRKKRLLVLGGSIWRDAIKQYAKENGIYIISAGLYPAGIDEIADETYRIDTTDAALMIPFIRDHHIDGVYMGGSELIISAACQYINKIGLPCYCTKTQWDILQNKIQFKELCYTIGLPTVPQFKINPKSFESSVDKDLFPVITKPADGCGSNGFTICNNYEDLKKGYEKAASNSPTNSVICEKYVNNNSVVVFYTFSEGKLYFSGLEDKISVKFRKQGTYVGGLFVFESDLTSLFRQRYEQKLSLLFNHIGVKEGTAWIEVFHEKDSFYFNEVGFRYGGSVSVYPVSYLYGYNQVAADIHYALTGKSNIMGHKPLIPHAPHKTHYAMYPVYLMPGKIGRIEGVDTIKSEERIVMVSITKAIGSIIPDSGSFNQNFAMLHFVYDTEEECGDILRFIHQELHVYDTKGKDIVLRMLNYDNVEMDALHHSLANRPQKERMEVTRDYFKRRMMNSRIYGGTSFNTQLADAIHTFLSDEQKSDPTYINTITDDIIDSYIEYRTRPSDYFFFGFNNLDAQSRSTYLTDTFEDQTLMDIIGYDKYLSDLTNKYHFYKKAQPFFHRKVFLFQHDTQEKLFLNYLNGLKSVFVKPLDGSEGAGSFIFDAADNNCSLYEKLKNSEKKWMVEERIVQCEEMSKWNPTSVNTVRLPTFLNGDRFAVLAPIFRTGRQGKPIDNTSAGGIFGLINPSEGIVCSHGYDIYGKEHERHPDSKMCFKGYKIPHWDDLLSVARQVHHRFPGHIYIAWDFALTEQGWDLIEGNWGRFRGAQIAGKKGLKKEFLNYIHGVF